MAAIASSLPRAPLPCSAASSFSFSSRRPVSAAISSKRSDRHLSADSLRGTLCREHQALLSQLCACGGERIFKRRRIALIASATRRSMSAFCAARSSSLAVIFRRNCAACSARRHSSACDRFARAARSAERRNTQSCDSARLDSFGPVRAAFRQASLRRLPASCSVRQMTAEPLPKLARAPSLEHAMYSIHFPDSAAFQPGSTPPCPTRRVACALTVALPLRTLPRVAARRAPQISRAHSLPEPPVSFGSKGPHLRVPLPSPRARPSLLHLFKLRLQLYQLFLHHP